MQRTNYATTSSRGIDFQGIPMRLFQKSKALAWDPWAIDLRQDRVEWEAMVDLERVSVLTTTASFVGGEEAVTLDLLPLLMHVARKGMLEEEIYLTSFLNEEAKHTEFFAAGSTRSRATARTFSRSLAPTGDGCSLRSCRRR